MAAKLRVRVSALDYCRSYMYISQSRSWSRLHWTMINALCTHGANIICIDGTPSCEESSASFPKKIVCSFGYAGNLTPELEWMTLGNSSWKVSCKASNAVVECVFERICTVNKLPSNANSFLTFCIEEHNTCEWGNGFLN